MILLCIQMRRQASSVAHDMVIYCVWQPVDVAMPRDLGYVPLKIKGLGLDDQCLDLLGSVSCVLMLFSQFKFDVLLRRGGKELTAMITVYLTKNGELLLGEVLGFVLRVQERKIEEQKYNLTWVEWSWKCSQCQWI